MGRNRYLTWMSLSLSLNIAVLSNYQSNFAVFCTLMVFIIVDSYISVNHPYCILLYLIRNSDKKEDRQQPKHSRSLSKLSIENIIHFESAGRVAKNRTTNGIVTAIDTTSASGCASWMPKIPR
jgi:hypothetical protein